MGLLTTQGTGGTPGASGTRISMRTAPVVGPSARSPEDGTAISLPFRMATIRAPSGIAAWTETVVVLPAGSTEPIAPSRPSDVARKSRTAGGAMPPLAGEDRPAGVGAGRQAPPGRGAR